MKNQICRKCRNYNLGKCEVHEIECYKVNGKFLDNKTGLCVNFDNRVLNINIETGEYEDEMTKEEIDDLT